MKYLLCTLGNYALGVAYEIICTMALVTDTNKPKVNNGIAMVTDSWTSYWSFVH